jgi:CHAD domain-containing protein
MTDTRAYRLQPDERADDGVRRIAHGQIALAREQLAGDGDVGEAVHEARKAFKRVRALARVARDELGDDVYRRENARYRATGRVLSGVRDAAVLVETLDALVARYRDELPRRAFAGLRATLDEGARAAHDALASDRGPIERVLGALDVADERVDGGPLDGGDVAVLAPGFARIYRRGRRALRRAERDADSEHLHELRKRAKDLWHATQVLRAAAPKKLKRLGRSAHELSDLLGDDHDLAVLLDAAHRHRRSLAGGERALLTALATRRRGELRRAALDLGRRVYKRKPRRVAGLIRGVPVR